MTSNDKGVIIERKIIHINPKSYVTFAPISSTDTDRRTIDVPKDKLSVVFDYDDKKGVLKYKNSVVVAQVGDIVTLYIPDIKEGTVPVILDFVKETLPNGAKILVKETNYANSFQLGATLLYVPPTQIKVDKISTVERMPTIRSRGSIKSQTGHTDTRITLSLFFPDVKSINDPDNGLRAIIAQFKRTPFVPVINNYLNFVHHVDAVCLHDLSVSTVPNFPRSLQATITLFAFEYMAYMPQEPSFLETIDADLYTWYFKRGLVNGGRDNNGKLRPITRNDSSISFSVVPEDEIARLQVERQMEASVKEISMEAGSFEEGFRKAVQDLETFEAMLKTIETLKGSSLEREPKTIERQGYKIIPLTSWFEEDSIAPVYPSVAKHQEYSVKIQILHADTLKQFRRVTREKDGTTWCELTWDDKNGWMSMEGFNGEKHYTPPVYSGHQGYQVAFVSEHEKVELENAIKETYQYYTSSLKSDSRKKLEEQIQQNVDAIAFYLYTNDIYKHCSIDKMALENAIARTEQLAKDNDIKRSKKEQEADRAAPTKAERDKGISYFIIRDGSNTYYCMVDFQDPANVAAGKKIREAGILSSFYHVYGDWDVLLAYRKKNGKWQWSQAQTRILKVVARNAQDAEQKRKQINHNFDAYLEGNVENIDSEKLPVAKFEDWDIDMNSAVVTDVQISYQNTFARLPLQYYEMPAFQFLGTEDVYAKISMEVFDDKTLEQLQNLYEYSQRLARTYRFDACYSFVKVRNELLQLFGVEYVMIDSLTCSTVPNFPGRYFVELTMMDYDIFQEKRENGEVIQMTGDDPIIVTDPKKNPVKYTPGYTIWMKNTPKDGSISENIYWMKIERLLGSINLYPDLDLPTCKEVDNYLKSIGRSPMYSNSTKIYVDPDFYFIPQNTLPEMTKKVMDGGPSIAINTKNEYRQLVTQNIIAGKTSVDIGQGITYEPNPDDLATKEEADAVKKQGFSIKHGPQAPRDRSSKWGEEWHDQMEWDCTGRMVRAFPTAHIFLIDEGVRVGWYRLWDNFYGMNAMSSIEIVRSRKIATDTAFVTVSNTYHRFIDRRFDIKDSKGRDIKFNLNRLFRLSIDETMKQAQANIQQHIGLFPGARLHIRIGYGNDLSQLPIVFNGTITEVGTGEVCTFIAQSDALELTNLLNYKKDTVGGFLQGGVEPTVLLLKLLERGDKEGIGYAWNVIKTNWQRPLDNPVQHFGVPTFFCGFMCDGGELGQNIYPANGTGIGHGEPMIDIELSNKTIWDVAQLLAMYIPNYIAAVHPFEFRSTLFYGKPHWDLTYGYEISATEKPGFKKATEWADGTGKELGYWIKAKKKPYRQWHVYSSFGHIISNKIKASSEGMYHNVIGRYRADKPIGQPYDAQVIMHADRDIYPNIQKTTSVECELLVKKPFPWPIVGVITGALSWYKEKTMTWKWAQNLCASAIRDYFMDMYQGELVIIGDPTVKPHDAIHLNDVYEEMFGNCFVKQVVQQFSLDTGFITSVSPDCAVAVVDDQSMDALTWGASLAIGSALAWSMTTKGASGIRAAAFIKGSEYARKVADVLSKAQRGVRSFKWGSAAIKAKAATQIFKTTRVITGVSGTLARIGTTAAAAGPPGWVVLMIEASLVIATDVIMSYVDRWAREQADCVIVSLLKYRGQEFSAGINGHKGISVGTLGGDTQRRYWDLIKSAMPTWVKNIFNLQEPNISPEMLFGNVSEASEQVMYQDTMLVWPTTGVISSVFGRRNTPPTDEKQKSKKQTLKNKKQTPKSSKYGWHPGIDIANIEGTKIFAAADGKVVVCHNQNTDINGLYIIIDHGEVKTCYCHLSKIDPSVKLNGYVSRGQLIGYMGHTGRSTGDHLHFGVYSKAAKDYVYPFDYLPEAGMLPIKKSEVTIDRSTGRYVNVLK